MPSRWIHPFVFGALGDEFYTSKARITSSGKNGLTTTEFHGVLVACCMLHAFAFVIFIMEVVVYLTLEIILKYSFGLHKDLKLAIPTCTRGGNTFL